MKIPEGFNLPEVKYRNTHFIKKRALYGLKQFGRMSYNKLSEYLSRKSYDNNHICPCVFVKKSLNGCHKQQYT